jgi:uridine kinase
MTDFAGIPLRLLPSPLGPRTKRPFLIAIDGIGTSGKSSLGAELARGLKGELIHVDDYFLPFSLRTHHRMTDCPMGNVEWERLEGEILRQAGNPRAVTRHFDCSAGEYSGPVEYDLSGTVIIEGVSSLRKELRDYYDLRIYIDISPEERLRRIALRDPEWKQRMWHSEWIPLEDSYTAADVPKKAADHIIPGTSFFMR